MSEYPFLSKEKIIEIGREHGIELDDSLTVPDMVEQLSKLLN